MMKKTVRQFRFLPILFTALFFGLHTSAQTVWKPFEASVTFKIKNFGITVDGSFKEFTGQMVFDPGSLKTSYLSGSVAIASINTGNSARDGHLQKEEYFDAEKYPRIELKTKSISKQGNDYIGKFDVTIKGKTKEMDIPFTFSSTGAEAKFEAAFTINRKDFGVGGNSAVMGDDVDIMISVTARK